MAFFEKVGQRISSAGQNVAQQTKNLTEITRLNSQISGNEKKITELFVAIGRAYYERVRDDETLQDESIQQVKELYAQIDEAQDRIKQIKGVEKCPQCGADVPQGALFCSNCGYKMEAAKPAGKQFCTACGAALEPGSLFCTACGHPVGGAPEQGDASQFAPEEQPGDQQQDYQQSDYQQSDYQQPDYQQPEE